MSDTENESELIEQMKQQYGYADQTDPNIQYDITTRQEFASNYIPERPELDTPEKIQEYRDNIGCAHLNGKPIKPHPYQNLLMNFINPLTPYKGLIIMHGLGSGKTRTGVGIAENFIPQCQKYGTKIVVLVPGPMLKANWKKEILDSTGEKYLKYIDKSVFVTSEDKEKIDKNAISLVLQHYRFMSYKSFYKHVLGEKIIDKKVSENSTKMRNVYRKNEDGDFERDLSTDRIYNLNNTLLIVDEAHQLTGNEYGEAVKHIINNSVNLKVILLTATPMKNLAHDIVGLVNFIRPKDSQIERDKIFTSHKNYKMDFKEGGKEYLKKMISGYFSYVRGADPLTYATRDDQGEVPDGLKFVKMTRCKMDDFQYNVYTENIEEIDQDTKEIDEVIEADENGENIDDSENTKSKDTLDRTSEAISNIVFPGLSEDKKSIVGYFGKEGSDKIKNQLKENYTLLNKKLSMMMFGNDNETDLIHMSHDNKTITGKMYKYENLKMFSTKFHQALTNINKLVYGQSGPKTAFVYSNLVKVGIDIFQEILLQNGYLEYQEDEHNYQLTPETVCYYCGQKHGEHNTQKNIPQHTFHPATFITITGQSSEDNANAMPEEKKKILDNIFNNINNKDGKKIKLCLGSKVMNEGISMKQTGEVHILDVYFNLGKVDQAVGRAIRYCSHYHLMNSLNLFPTVKVFKYVVCLEKGKLSAEEQLYKKAEEKYLLINKVERIIKETAIDCALNLNANIFKEEVEKYKDCEKEDGYKCPAQCNYMSCEYKCGNEKLNAEFYDPSRKIYRKLLKHEINTTTFNNDLARNEIENAKEKIKDMFIIKYSYTLHDILKYVKSQYDENSHDLFDEFFVYKALDELIPITENDFNNFKDTITDKYHRQGYLIYRKQYYIFQPFDQNENTPMYYRTNVDKKLVLNLSLNNYIKMTDKFKNQMETKQKSQFTTDETENIYDYETVMYYYDNRNENDFVGIIDKETNKKKNKSLDDIKDVFKLREKRAKILDKKRVTGLPSLKGAVCYNAKDKKYLLKVAKKLGVELSSSNSTREDICVKIEDKMLMLEKYATNKDKNKLTYVMIPANHPTLPFPYNLEDRVEHIIEQFNKIVKTKIDISSDIKKDKKTDLPYHIITIKNTNKITDVHDKNNFDDLLQKYNGKKKDKDYQIIVD